MERRDRGQMRDGRLRPAVAGADATPVSFSESHRARRAACQQIVIHRGQYRVRVCVREI
jgi:hypothetical protein